MKKSLKHKLLVSHSSLAGFGIVLLLVSLVSTLWLRESTHLLASESIPKVKTLHALAMGTQSSLTALRSWMVLGDPEFRTERARVWKEDIWPHIERLQEGDRGRGRTDRLEELGKLNFLFADLFELQWKIEDVVNTPGNEPARVHMDRDVTPIVASIEETLSSLYESEKTSGRAIALERFGFAFRQSYQYLSRFMETGEPSQEKQFSQALESARQSISNLVKDRARFTQNNGRRLLNLQTELNHIQTFAKEVISLRKSDQWNIAENWLNGRLIPLEREIRAHVQVIRSGLEEEVAAKTDEAAFIGNMAISISLLLIVVMILTAIFVSRYWARRIVSPIVAIGNMAEQIEAGNLKQENVLIQSSDEIGYLGKAFNHMLGELRKFIKYSEDILSGRTEKEDFDIKGDFKQAL